MHVVDNREKEGVIGRERKKEGEGERERGRERESAPLCSPARAVLDNTKLPGSK